MRHRLFAILLTLLLAAAQAASPLPPLPRSNDGEPAAPKGYRLQPGDATSLPLDPKTLKNRGNPDRVKSRAWYMTGRYRAAKNDLKGALAAFEQAVKYDSTRVMIYRDMLQAALRLNRVADAVGYAKKAVAINPDDYQLLRWLSRQMIRQRKLAEAISLMEQARRSKKIDRHSGIFVNIMRDLGLMYVGTGKQPAASECFEVVFEALQDPRRYKLDERTRRSLRADTNISYERLGQVFLAAKRTDLAVRAFRAAAKSGKGNPGTLGYNLAQVYHKTGKHEQALGELQEYFDRKLKSKGRAAYALLADILKGLDKSGELLKRLEKLAGHDPDNPLLQIFLADQYVGVGRFGQAESLYERGLVGARGNDREPAYWGLAGLHRRDVKAAPLLEALGNAVDVRGDLKRLDAELKAVAAEKKLRGKLLKEARRQAGDKAGQAPFARRFVAARLAVQLKKNKDAATLLTWAIAAPKSVSEIKDRLLLNELRGHVDVLTRTLMVDRDYRTSAMLLRAAADDTTLGPFKTQFLFQLSQAFEFDGKTPEALAAVGEARRSSNHPLLHYQEGWIYYHANQWDKAVPLFEKVIKDFPNETSVVRRCQFSLSNIYVLQGDIKKGEAVLETVFAVDPDNPSVNNDLGYLYADQGKKLEQAEKMIRKALKAEPDNSAYQDSMGWVLFKRGRFAEALKFLQKASSGRDGEDPTILEHLGDCFQKLEQPKKSRGAWKKALKLAKHEKRPDKKLIQRVEQKLKDSDE